MNRFFSPVCLILIVQALIGCSSRPTVEADYNIIPLPQSIDLEGNDFHLSESTVVTYPSGNDTLRRNAELFVDYLKPIIGYSPAIEPYTNQSFDVIVMSSDYESANPEAYKVCVDSAKITVDGATARGNFYGLQLLRKAIDVSAKNSGKVNVDFPGAVIEDAPRFPYRGAHLDVSRHFMPLDSVKAFVDLIAMHNVNNFHWHLTDDQGWRIEIPKYPLLTELGSVRPGTVVGGNIGVYDSIPHGGFYTAEQAHELIAYAADRHINVIPEIDLPGHMLGALKGYPNLGCTGGPYELWQIWGVADDVLCAGNDSVYTFITDIVDEITRISPSPLIHMGGDECPKTRWRECPKCQAKIKQLELTDDANSSAEDKLQTHVMTHAAKALAAKGRRMIGWDEILEGESLPDGAIIMSWRGVDGASHAVKKGHDVILTPTSHCYFDYCQTVERSNEPLSFGLIEAEKVLSFEPVPADINSEQEALILGTQSNLWTEYITSLSHAEYMELPRLAALCEVQWRPRGEKDYADFIKRFGNLAAHYDRLGYNYARHIYNVTSTKRPDAENRRIEVDLSTPDGAPIHYTTDGSIPTIASPIFNQTDSLSTVEGSAASPKPLLISESTVIHAAAERNGSLGPILNDTIVISKSTFCPVTLSTTSIEATGKKSPEVAKILNTANPAVLTDGSLGRTFHRCGDWVTMRGDNLIATIDLINPQTINSVTVRNYAFSANWVFDTRGIEVATSLDGSLFTSVASEEIPQAKVATRGITPRTFFFPPIKARFVRVTVLSEQSMPSFMESAEGEAAHIAIDEIIVE